MREQVDIYVLKGWYDKVLKPRAKNVSAQFLCEQALAEATASIEKGDTPESYNFTMPIPYPLTREHYGKGTVRLRLNASNIGRYDLLKSIMLEFKKWKQEEEGKTFLQAEIMTTFIHCALPFVDLKKCQDLRRQADSNGASTFQLTYRDAPIWVREYIQATMLAFGVRREEAIQMLMSGGYQKLYDANPALFNSPEV